VDYLADTPTILIPFSQTLGQFDNSLTILKGQKRYMVFASAADPPVNWLLPVLEF